VVDCLEQWQAFRERQSPIADRIDEGALVIAVFYHDAIYQPLRSDNEAASARLAAEQLGAQRSQEQVELIQSLILATAHFGNTPENRPSSLAAEILVDIDLSILGREEAIYEAYAAAVRKEYASVPEWDYRRGRCQVLERFLALPLIFHQSYFRDRYEPAARRNLRRELDRLTA
jgi:predicted metal-dependent HD superfamily phosphohydrolase